MNFKPPKMLKDAWQKAALVKTTSIADGEAAIAWLAEQLSLDVMTVKKGLLGDTDSNRLVADPDETIAGMLAAGQDVIMREKRLRLIDRFATTTAFAIVPVVTGFGLFDPYVCLGTGAILLSPAVLWFNEEAVKQNEAQVRYGAELSVVRASLLARAEAFDLRHGCDAITVIEAESSLAGQDLPSAVIHTLGEFSPLTERRFRPSHLEIT